MMVMQRRQPSLNAIDWLGWTIWIVGFIFEVVADYQKSQFRSDPANAGKFINTGLWSLSIAIPTISVKFFSGSDSS
jgi:steroid 5-alpha reductase family enzyme